MSSILGQFSMLRMGNIPVLVWKFLVNWVGAVFITAPSASTILKQLTIFLTFFSKDFFYTNLLIS